MKNPILTEEAIHDMVLHTEVSQWSLTNIVKHFYYLGVTHGIAFSRYEKEQKELDEIW